MVARAASLIADQQVRNRGTIGGSLAHGDPASDLPDRAARARRRGHARAGRTASATIAAADLFQDYLTTSLAHDEVITEVRLPDIEGYGFGYQKFTRRAEDWAMVGVCALVSGAPDGTCEDVRIGADEHGRHAAARDARPRRRCAAASSTTARSPPRRSRPPRARTRRAT